MLKTISSLAQNLAIVTLLFLASSHSIAAKAASASAVFAGGCFWCMESDFEKLEGVNEVVSGFTGGTLKNPTYKGDHSGHYEAVKVDYDNSVISYPQLLEVFWKSVDPFDGGGQFCDRGPSYLSAVFVANAEQRAAANQSKQSVGEQFPEATVVTPILNTGAFYPVEEYHQDYYKKRTFRYKFYRSRCGRDARLKEIWGSKK